MTKTARHKRGGGSNHQGAADAQAGDTNEARAHGEPGSGRPRKTNKTQRQGQGHPGPETRESRRRRGRTKEEKKNEGTERERGKTRDTEGEAGGGDSNHQRTINGQPGHRKQARAHQEPEGGERKTQSTESPARQTQTSAKAQGTRSRKTQKARDKGGADKRRKEKQAQGNEERQQQREEGGGGATTGERPAARQHKESESARGAKKRKANKTNSTKRQGPGHPGPETKESKRQRGRNEKKSGRGGRGGQTKDQNRNTPTPEGPSKAERQSGQSKRCGALERTWEAGPPDPAKKSKHTHTRTEPGRGVLRPARGGVGVHRKQPWCTGRVPRRTTDGTGNRTRQ